MKTSSAKAKGRKLQQRVASLLLEIAKGCQLDLTADDIKSTPMGVGGPDLQLSSAAKDIFPFNFECRNRASCNVLTEFKELSEKNKPGVTVGVFKRTSRSKRASTEPVYVMDETTFYRLAHTYALFCAGRLKPFSNTS